MENEDEYPALREEEEDLGDPYTSEELHQEAGTVPSRSLVDDILESSARRYHANISKLLLSTRTLCRERLEAMGEELNRLIQRNPAWKREKNKSACDYANAAWEKERGEFERQMQQVMSAETDVWKERDTKIRQFCEEKPS